MAGTPASVKEYLEGLPEERRKAITKVRAAVNRGLPKGYREGIQYGMIGWCVPRSLFPEGYHCDPKQGVPFAGLASQKNYMSLYLNNVYGDPDMETWFRDAYARSGKRLDMGKSCVRFRRLDDLALDVIGESIARTTVDGYLAHYRKARGSSRQTRGTASR